MKMKALKKRGDCWKATLVDDAGAASNFILAYMRGESLADAAVRVEDVLRALQAGQVKPADSGLHSVK